LEIEKVGAFCIAQVVQPAASGGLLEPVANGVLAGMAERRVADIVGQASRLHDHAEVGRTAPFRHLLAQHLTDAHAKRSPDAADFQRVCQPGVDMIIAGNRIYLGLASKSAEGSGKDDAVVVLVKRAATEFIGAVHGFPKPFTGEQGVPVQDYLHIAFSVTARRIARSLGLARNSVALACQGESSALS